MGIETGALVRTFATTLKCLEEGANLGVGPVLCADVLAADNALAIDHVGLRPHVRVEELGGRLAGSRTVIRSTWRRAMKRV